MKKYALLISLLLLPFASYAVGIDELNRSLIMNITGMGILIVIGSLTVVSLMVALMSRIMKYFETRNERNAKNNSSESTQKLSAEVDNNEVMVAIAAALHCEIKELEDEERAILTIRKIVKPFSAWNNKSYGMRQSVRGSWSD